MKQHLFCYNGLVNRCTNFSYVFCFTWVSNLNGQIGDDFIIVNLDNHGRSIGEEVTTCTHLIGNMVIMHQYAPINIKSWKKKILRNYMNDMLEV